MCLISINKTVNGIRLVWPEQKNYKNDTVLFYIPYYFFHYFLLDLGIGGFLFNLLWSWLWEIFEFIFIYSLNNLFQYSREYLRHMKTWKIHFRRSDDFYFFFNIKHGTELRNEKTQLFFVTIREKYKNKATSNFSRCISAVVSIFDNILMLLSTSACWNTDNSV